jgi:hypothetical protein
VTWAPLSRSRRPSAAGVRARAALVSSVAALALLGLAGGAPAADRELSWASLTVGEQQALAPLKREWGSIDANRRQKWLEVAARFPKLPEGEQARVQQRMAEWAALTPTERARARLQFRQAQGLTSEERQARWQAYQALPEQERQRLAQSARPGNRRNGVPEGAASAAAGRSAAGPAPTSKSNVVTLPSAPPPRAVAPTVVQARPGVSTTTMAAQASPPMHHQAGLPKIVATPGFVDPATLLPRRGPQAAAVPASPALAASSPARRR